MGTRLKSYDGRKTSHDHDATSREDRAGVNMCIIVRIAVTSYNVEQFRTSVVHGENSFSVDVFNSPSRIDFSDKNFVFLKQKTNKKGHSLKLCVMRRKITLISFPRSK